MYEGRDTGMQVIAWIGRRENKGKTGG